MGGPMNIYEEVKYPWLAPEKALIRKAIAGGKYVIGICLGGQLIAEALGAAVTKAAQPEIGWHPIQSVAGCPAWCELPKDLTVMHWHGEQFEIPKDAKRIAASKACKNQGFIYADRVLAWQCHLEATPESLAALVDACGDELTALSSSNSAERLLAEPLRTYERMQQALFALLDRMTTSITGIEVIDWGLTDYADAFAQQKSRVEQRRAGECGDALIFTEHSPVYTMGMRKDSEQHLLWSKAECSREGIAVFKSNRGGDITYHGPGQIVGYPILSLAHRKDLHAYLRDLEELVIRSLATYGLAAARREGKTGIWLNNERKICAIGVAVRSWVTYHGFALNVCPDMAHFDGIVPCGISDGSVTSLANELDRAVEIAEVKARLAVEFKQVFRNSPQ
jgi:lipoate-protein ligase B